MVHLGYGDRIWSSAQSRCANVGLWPENLSPVAERAGLSSVLRLDKLEGQCFSTDLQIETQA